MTGVSTSCGACKFLRRKCTSECIFAPYFSYDEAAIHFSAVHKVFGASNVSRLLLHLPEQHRSEAAISISYEALARMQDPVYGCVSYIYALQQEVSNLQDEIEVLGNCMANLGNGFTDDHCGSSSQVTNNVSITTTLQCDSTLDVIFEATNVPINNSLQFSSQECPANSPGYYWSNIEYQHEILAPTRAENGACSNQILSNQMDTSICEWEGRHLSGVPDPMSQGREGEGLLHQETLDFHRWMLN